MTIVHHGLWRLSLGPFDKRSGGRYYGWRWWLHLLERSGQCSGRIP